MPGFRAGHHHFVIIGADENPQMKNPQITQITPIKRKAGAEERQERKKGRT